MELTHKKNVDAYKSWLQGGGFLLQGATQGITLYHALGEVDAIAFGRTPEQLEALEKQSQTTSNCTELTDKQLDTLGHACDLDWRQETAGCTWCGCWLEGDGVDWSSRLCPVCAGKKADGLHEPTV